MDTCEQRDGLGRDARGRDRYSPVISMQSQATAAGLLHLGHREAEAGGKHGLHAPAPPPAVEEHLPEEEGTGKHAHT